MKIRLPTLVLLMLSSATLRAAAAPQHGHEEAAAAAARSAVHNQGDDRASSAHGEEHSHEAPNPLESGTISNALATLITFGLLLFILGKWVWPKVLKALHDREQFILASLNSAKQDRQEAQKLLGEYKAQLEQARLEATRIVEEGRRDAEVVRRQIMDDARGEADATLTRARREIDIARDTAVKDLYAMAGNLATQLAGKILQKELDPAAHDRLIRDSIERIARLRNGK